jgi:oxygen-independent coproporphyrinogen-3 oxidase
MEPGTAMQAAHARGAFTLPDEDEAATLYEATQELCGARGFDAYEVSNHARADAACRHNLTYWRGGDYVGIGPGAHGRVMIAGTLTATRQVKAPALWLKQVSARGHGTQEEEHLAPATRAEELILMGLRLSEGIDAARFERLSGQRLEETLVPGAADFLAREGYLQATGRGLAATERGRLALNAVVAKLLN